MLYVKVDEQLHTLLVRPLTGRSYHDGVPSEDTTRLRLFRSMKRSIDWFNRKGRFNDSSRDR